MKKTTKSYNYILPMLVLGIVSFLFSYNLEWYGDPIDYKFIEPDDFTAIPDTPVKNLRDIWQSQCNHYFTSNGRFFVHFITQIFCGLAGKLWFALFNAIIWTLLPWLTLRFAVGKRPTAAMTTTASILIFALLAAIRFDPPFQINYAWTLALILLWFPIFLNRARHSALNITAAAIFSFFCGECNESFSIPVCFGIAAYAIYRKFALTPRQWACAVLFGIGSIIMVAAPGNWLRLESLTPGTKFSLLALSNILPGLIIPAVTIVVAWFHSKDIERRLSAEALFFVVLVAVNFSLGLVTGYGWGPRMLVPGNICLIFLTLKLLKDHSFPTWLNIAGVAICIIFALFMGLKTQGYNRTERLIYSEYAKSTDGIIYLEDSVFVSHDRRIIDRLKEYRMEGSASYPEKPSMIIRPEIMRNLTLENDTNMAVRLGAQSWLLVQSVRRPADFIVEKTILPDFIDYRMGDRVLDFNLKMNITFEEHEGHRFAIYKNERPYVNASLRINQ